MDQINLPDKPCKMRFTEINALSHLHFEPITTYVFIIQHIPLVVLDAEKQNRAVVDLWGLQGVQFTFGVGAP